MVGVSLRCMTSNADNSYYFIFRAMSGDAIIPVGHLFPCFCFQFSYSSTLMGRAEKCKTKTLRSIRQSLL
jgi:hypothetical protein